MIKVENLVLGVCATNCYLVYNSDTKETIIFDPAASPQRIIDRIEELSLSPVAIFITHGHFDHILAINEIREKYNIKAYALNLEEEILTDSYKNLSVPFTGEAFSASADEYLTDGDELSFIGSDITVIGIKGHTIGGACYYFANEGVLISGDTLFNCSVGRSDFPTGSAAMLIRDIDEKLMTLPDDVVVYPGHGEATSIGYERVNNGFINFK